MLRRKPTLITVIAAATLALAGALTAISSASADRGTEVFRGTLMQLNDSGVTGTVRVIDTGGSLRVKLDARGVESMQMHMSHIHGHGPAGQATCPTMASAGPDGILSVGEGAPAYGPVWVTLANDMTESRLKFNRTFTNTDAGGPGKGAPVDDMGSLGRYAVVVHGLTAADDGDAPADTPGPGYQPLLPVACAVLTMR